MSSLSTPYQGTYVTLDVKNHIARLTLCRGDKFNALSGAVLEELLQVLDSLKENKAARVVVLAAQGRAFCAGHDLKEMRKDSSYETMKGLFDLCSKVMMAYSQLPQPVIARVHGIATAAGCQLVGACDLAVASSDARFATSGINVGLFCSTPMVALTRNVGAKKAFEMLVTGDFISASDALSLGLVNRVVDPDDLDEAVMELANKITRQSPASIAMGKSLFYRQIEAPRKEAYDIAAETMAKNMLCQDAQNGIDAFIEKRPMPDWKGC